MYGPPPVAPPPKRDNKVWLIIALVGVLVMCGCLGIGGLLLIGDDDETDEAAPSSSASATTTPTRSQKPTVRDEYDPTSFRKGDCVVNEGTDDKPVLRRVTCGPDAFKVLIKIPFSSDGDECEKVAPEATVHYTSDVSGSTRDFVLCLKEYQ